MFKSLISSLFLLTAALFFPGCESNGLPQDTSVALAISHIEYLSETIGARTAGSPEESAAAERMKQPEFRIRLEVGDGTGRAEFWTSDLSHEYVRINAEYRT